MGFRDWREDFWSGIFIFSFSLSLSLSLSLQENENKQQHHSNLQTEDRARNFRCKISLFNYLFFFLVCVRKKSPPSSEPLHFYPKLCLEKKRIERKFDVL